MPATLPGPRLDVAGVKDPYAAQRDGISLGPLLRGEAAALKNPDTLRVGILVSLLVLLDCG